MFATVDPSISVDLARTGLEGLKTLAHNDPRAAAKGAASEFEALMAQMLLKAMRETSFVNEDESPFESRDVRFYTSLMDEQVARIIGRNDSFGLAKVLSRQLADVSTAPQIPGNPQPDPLQRPGTEPVPLAPPPAQSPPVPSLAPTTTGPRPSAAGPTSASNFVERLWPHVAEVARIHGIPPKFMLAHAALETGWGVREPTLPDGSSSHNLFGIKAGPGWTGAVAEAPTTEYVNGAPTPVTGRFRAYASDREAVEDYARLMSTGRYANVFQPGSDSAAMARGLAGAGYATDPLYADKLVRIMNGSRLRAALAG